MKKPIIDVLFILIAAVFLVVLSQYGLLEKYIGLSLIPILIAYQLGQYSERKFKKR
ncbi:hypothetical protein ACVWYG_000440 [Pedobacter sp. UYEF25]